MSATLQSIQQTGYHIIDNDIYISNSLTLGSNSCLCFRGGRFVNATTNNTITIFGSGISIVADAVQIFVGQFIFKEPNSDTDAHWNMDRAYPQWFGAKDCSQIIGRSSLSNYDIRYSCVDCADAINQAIRIKQVGEVFIPRGFYKISKYINVLPGITLRGECDLLRNVYDSGTNLFPWESAGQQSSDLSFYTKQNYNPVNGVIDFSSIRYPKPPKDVAWYNSPSFNNSQEIGYLILANINTKATFNFAPNAVGTSYPISIDYYPITKFPPPCTEICNINIFDLNRFWESKHQTSIGAASEYRYHRARLSDGSIKLNNVSVDGLSQVMETIGSYSDARSISSCSFSAPSFSESEYELLPSLYLSEIYAFDLTGYGDALVFDNNHISSFCSRIGALHIDHCNGGSIRSNILNSDILLELCRAIDFCANHIEYGAKLTIASSAAGIRNNLFWRGRRPSISIRRFGVESYYYFHSKIELDCNSFFTTWHPANIVSDDTTIGPFDIATDNYASINIRNCCRTSNKTTNGEGSYAGIQIASFKLSVDESHLIEDDYLPLTDFNNISHIASIQSSINGLKVSPLPITLLKTDFELPIGLQVYAHPNNYGWQAELGVTYQYKLWIFADYSRGLVLSGPIVSSAIMPQSNQCIRLLIGKGDHSNYDLLAGPFITYIERSDVSTGTPRNLKSLVVPICSCTQLYDDGANINGFEWTSIATSKANDIESLKLLNLASATFYGNNIQCRLNSSDNVINSNWRDGDLQIYADGSNIKERILVNNTWKIIKQ